MAIRRDDFVAVGVIAIGAALSGALTATALSHDRAHHGVHMHEAGPESSMPGLHLDAGDSPVRVIPLEPVAPPAPAAGAARAPTQIQLRSRSIEPLVYVDGLRVDRSVMQDLDPDRIDRIEVLKGDAAAAFDQDAAGRGVVQIFLKPGGGGI